MYRATLTNYSLEWGSRHGIRRILFLCHSMSSHGFIRRLKTSTDTKFPALQQLPNAKLVIVMARSQATNRSSLQAVSCELASWGLVIGLPCMVVEYPLQTCSAALEVRRVPRAYPIISSLSTLLCNLLLSTQSYILAHIYILLLIELTSCESLRLLAKKGLFGYSLICKVPASHVDCVHFRPVCNVDWFGQR